MGTLVADIVDTLAPLTLSTGADVEVGAGTKGMMDELKKTFVTVSALSQKSQEDSLGLVSR